MTDILEEMRRISSLPNGVKKLRLEGGGLFIFQKDKLIISDSKGQKHLTFWITEDGITDVHRTTEGKVRSHESLDRIDMRWLDDQMAEKLFYASCGVVRPDDPELERMTIRIAKERKDVSDRWLTVKGHTAKLNSSVLDELENNMRTLTFEEFDKTSDVAEALVYDGDDWIGTIYWTPKGYIFYDQRQFNKLVDSRVNGESTSSAEAQ